MIKKLIARMFWAYQDWRYPIVYADKFKLADYINLTEDDA
jgi:hypothetical protein